MRTRVETDIAGIQRDASTILTSMASRTNANQRTAGANANLRQVSVAQNSLTQEATKLKDDLVSAGCSQLGQGCFAAGSKLMSPNGPKAIEDFKVGDLITSRNEFVPDGELEAKQVEEVFRRSAPILHLHVNGQLIRTTGEHPFYAFGKGWINASLLEIGDRLLCQDGQWVAVEDVLETGEWEVVYNLRIADYHTYFVTDWDWGFSVWSHNIPCLDNAETQATINRGLASLPEAVKAQVLQALRLRTGLPAVADIPMGGFTRRQVVRVAGDAVGGYRYTSGYTTNNFRSNYQQILSTLANFGFRPGAATERDMHGTDGRPIAGTHQASHAEAKALAEGIRTLAVSGQVCPDCQQIAVLVSRSNQPVVIAEGTPGSTGDVRIFVAGEQHIFTLRNDGTTRLRLSAPVETWQNYLTRIQNEDGGNGG